MDNEKVNAAFREALETIARAGFDLEEGYRWGDKALQAASEVHRLNLRVEHVIWMCKEAGSWGAERIEKKFRWLGFVQGVLWALGMRSIEDMKKDNMPAGEVRP